MSTTTMTGGVEAFLSRSWQTFHDAADTCPGPLLARLRHDLADLAELLDDGQLVAVPRALALAARSRAAVEAWS